MRRLLMMIVYCTKVLFGDAQTIQITTGQTTSLVFPFPVQHVDRGSASILVKAVEEAANILLVKAAGKDFAATNLTVITSDGSTYALAMQYAEAPVQWVYALETKREVSPEMYANSIIDHPRTIGGMKDQSWDMHGRVIGIYIKDHTIYYQVRLRNDSPIDYEPEFLRFFTRDRRRSKRTATQENEILPKYIAGNIKLVKSKQQQNIVVALEKFTIPDAKYLAIQVMEKNGGRHLLIRVSNRKIVKAKLLSDLK